MARIRELFAEASVRLFGHHVDPPDHNVRYISQPDRSEMHDEGDINGCDKCDKFADQQFDAESAGNTEQAIDVTNRWQQHMRETHGEQ